jgi:predicted ABC-type ATPase
MTAATHPTFWLIAGPDGVGRTTFAIKRLEAIFRFDQLRQLR